VRKLVFVLAMTILAWAALVVPLPLMALEPVPAQPVDAIVEMPDARAEIPDGLLFTAVQVRQQTAAGAIEVWIDEHASLTFAPTVVPQGVDPEEFIDLQVALFEESVRTAAAVGMRAAGEDVTISGDGARIVRTVPGTPADGALERGDVIVEVDGQQISLASEVSAVLSRQQTGDDVEITVRRGGERVTETITLVELAEVGGPGIGVLASTVNLRIDTPLDVQPRPGTQVGGPSAGLMIALGVYEATTETDLARGRTIAGTGFIDTSGNVGPISGIAEKVRGAELAGADTFLAPAAQAEEADAAAPDGLEVISVESLQDAIEALQG
jgi:PDZ domain-containing protein